MADKDADLTVTVRFNSHDEISAAEIDDAITNALEELQDSKGTDISWAYTLRLNGIVQR